MKSRKNNSFSNNSHPCLSVLSTDMFCAVHVTPVHQCAVYWYVLRSTCDSRASVCCLLICSAQYMWLSCCSMLSTELFHTVHVAPLSQYSVHRTAVCSTRGSCTLICCTQYTWFMSIVLLYAVHVAHVHWFTICCTRGSRPLICCTRGSYPLIWCTQYMWLPCFNMLSTDRLYASQVTPLPQYIVYWPTVRSPSDTCIRMLSLDMLPSYESFSPSIFPLRSKEWSSIGSTWHSCGY